MTCSERRPRRSEPTPGVPVTPPQILTGFCPTKKYQKSLLGPCQTWSSLSCHGLGGGGIPSWMRRGVRQIKALNGCFIFRRKLHMGGYGGSIHARFCYEMAQHSCVRKSILHAHYFFVCMCDIFDPFPRQEFPPYVPSNVQRPPYVQPYV